MTAEDILHINDNTQIEPPNSHGYSKVSVQHGNKHKEDVIDASGKEVIVPSTQLLAQDISSSLV